MTIGKQSYQQAFKHIVLANDHFFHRTHQVMNELALLLHERANCSDVKDFREISA